MCEMSASSKLFQFLVALCPSKAEALLFGQDLKLVLKCLGLCLFHFLFCFCVLEDSCLGISTCLKSLTVVCAQDFSLAYTFCKWFIIYSACLHRGKCYRREEKSVVVCSV